MTLDKSTILQFSPANKYKRITLGAFFVAIVFYGVYQCLGIIQGDSLHAYAEKNYKENIDRGYNINDAILDYISREGSLPANLSELVKKEYLQQQDLVNPYTNLPSENVRIGTPNAKGDYTYLISGNSYLFILYDDMNSTVPIVGTDLISNEVKDTILLYLGTVGLTGFVVDDGTELPNYDSLQTALLNNGYVIPVQKLENKN